MNEGTRLITDTELPQLAMQSYRLEVRRGPNVGAHWDLRGDVVRIGKGPENDIVIVDATVSRNHLELKKTLTGHIVRDLGSTNGTFIGENRIVEAFVAPGTEIRLGEVVLLFRATHEGLDIDPSRQSSFGQLVGESPPMRRIFALLDRVAPTDATVLIIGETGTGKGAAARTIHDHSSRAAKPLVTVDCGAISRNLIESELFGHEKGSFTGASQLRRGALEMCDGGTLFIDELDDLPLDVQPKLLRALEEREITRVGANKPIKLDLRVIAATKKDLKREVAEGRFREDLYYRLSIVTFTLPPLRDRMEDIPLLANSFLAARGSQWEQLPKTLRDRLLHHNFPGNVRELRNLLERASYLNDVDAIDVGSFPTELRREESHDTEFRLNADYMKPFKTAKESLIDTFEKEYIRRLLIRNDFKISRAAREAEIDRKYLYLLMSKHNLSAPDEGEAS